MLPRCRTCARHLLFRKRRKRPHAQHARAVDSFPETPPGTVPHRSTATPRARDLALHSIDRLHGRATCRICARTHLSPSGCHRRCATNGPLRRPRGSSSLPSSHQWERGQERPRGRRLDARSAARESGGGERQRRRRHGARGGVGVAWRRGRIAAAARRRTGTRSEGCGAGRLGALLEPISPRFVFPLRTHPLPASSPSPHLSPASSPSPRLSPAGIHYPRRSPAGIPSPHPRPTPHEAPTRPSLSGAMPPAGAPRPAERTQVHSGSSSDAIE